MHSENKEGTGPNYKGGYGFHPMGCFADATGEALSMLLRPGNAGANDAEDHLAVLDDAIAQLPGVVAAGHSDETSPREVRRRIVVRTDSAGATNDFVWGCFDRNVGFSVTARTKAQVYGAIAHIADDEAPLEASPAPRRQAPQGSGRRRGDRPGGPLQVAPGHPPHHPARATAPRGPTEPVPQPRVPLLGPLHRPVGHPGVASTCSTGPMLMWRTTSSG